MSWPPFVTKELGFTEWVVYKTMISKLLVMAKVQRGGTVMQRCSEGGAKVQRCRDGGLDMLSRS